ncbi:MAG: hypothetical protein JWN86_792 [Planctomycetota bacterium]|nr:hypothetical protein [Planctomycetota bacterium]
MMRPRVRLTVRGMMAVVAVAAVVTWSAGASNRFRRCGEKIREFAEAEAIAVQIIAQADAQRAYCRGRVAAAHASGEATALEEWSKTLAQSEAQFAETKEVLEYAHVTRLLYTRAAWRPWETIPEEPPLPKQLEEAKHIYETRYDHATGRPLP